MYWDCSSNVTRANAVVPSAEIWWDPSGVYGDMIVVTWGTSATLANMASMSAWTLGSVTFSPFVVAKTICSVSPATLGEACCSRSMASVDWVLGRVKLLENRLPAEWASRTVTTSVATQNKTTRRRCR